MNIFTEQANSLKSHAIQYIHEFVKENGKIPLCGVHERYLKNDFMEIQDGVVVITTYSDFDGEDSQSLLTGLNVDTLCKMADGLIKLKYGL